MPPPFTRRFLHADSVSNNYTSGGGGNVTVCALPDCLFPPIDFSSSPPIDFSSSPPIPSFHVPDPIVIDVHRSNRFLYIFLAAAAALIAVSFLLFCFLLLLRRRRLHLNSQIVHPDAGGLHHLQNGSNRFSDSFDGTHHVWAIRTIGLDESLIKSITSKVYKTGDQQEDCSVCLGVFNDGEMVKLLPGCKHCFHTECIDTWLKAHVSCPLCRALVLDEGVLKSDQLEVLEQNQESNDVSSSSTSRRDGSEDENEVQPKRRSVSMDAWGVGMLMIRGDLEKGKEGIELENSGNNKNDAVEMKMSMSSRSGRFFFSIYGRGRSASVLPF